MSNSDINTNQELDYNTKLKFDDILSKCDENQMKNLFYQIHEKIYDPLAKYVIDNDNFLNDSVFVNDFLGLLNHLKEKQDNTLQDIGLKQTIVLNFSNNFSDQSQFFLALIPNTDQSIEAREEIINRIYNKCVERLINKLKNISSATADEKDKIKTCVTNVVRANYFPINEFSPFITTDDTKNKIINMSLKELYELNKYQSEKIDYNNKTMFQFKSIITLTPDKKKMIEIDYYGVPIFKLEVVRRTKTQVVEVVNPVLTKTETYDGIENIRKYFDNNLFIENGKEIFMKKASFKDLYRAFCDDEEKYKSVNPSYHIQQKTKNIIHMLEEDKDPVYQSIQKHKKIQKQLQEYEKSEKKQKEKQMEREQKYFKDKIKDEYRETEDYEAQMRKFEVNDYLNQMYTKNKLYKVLDDKLYEENRETYMNILDSMHKMGVYKLIEKNLIAMHQKNALKQVINDTYGNNIDGNKYLTFLNDMYNKQHRYKDLDDNDKKTYMEILKKMYKSKYFYEKLDKKNRQKYKKYTNNKIVREGLAKNEQEQYDKNRHNFAFKLKPTSLNTIKNSRKDSFYDIKE